jgi:hypothetical protein
MLDLINTTEETHYESYRQGQLETRKPGENRPTKNGNPKFKEEEEALRKRFTEQVKQEELRFRQWEQHVRRLLHLTHVRVIDGIYSLLLSVIVSTRILRPLTARSRVLRPSSMGFKLAIVRPLVVAEREGLLSPGGLVVCSYICIPSCGIGRSLITICYRIRHDYVKAYASVSSGVAYLELAFPSLCRTRMSLSGSDLHGFSI